MEESPAAPFAVWRTHLQLHLFQESSPVLCSPTPSLPPGETIRFIYFYSCCQRHRSEVCRSRTRTRQVAAEKVVVVTSYRSPWPKELDLNRGDLVQVLFKDDEAWWFGRLPTGHQGYFPASCVELLQGGAVQATPPLRRRVSVPAVPTDNTPCGCTSGRSTPKLLRKNSVRRLVSLDGPSESLEPGGSAAHGSPSLLHRVLAKSRRKSCPQLPHPAPDSGTINTAFQPD